MAKTCGQTIRQRAISELESLSLSLDEELEITANMTIAEIDDELRELDVDPNRLSSVSLRPMLSEKFELKNSAYAYVSDELQGDIAPTSKVKLLICQLMYLSQQERYDEALKLAKQEIEIAPHYWRAWVSYGSLLAVRGNLDQAEAIFHQMQQDFSSNPKAVAAALHGCACVKEARFKLNPSDEDLIEVARLYEKALEFDNSRANTRACLVINSFLSCQTNKANQILQESLQYEGFVDAMMLELTERGAKKYGAKMYKVIQALLMQFRNVLYGCGPDHGEIGDTGLKLQMALRSIFLSIILFISALVISKGYAIAPSYAGSPSPFDPREINSETIEVARHGFQIGNA